MSNLRNSFNQKLVSIRAKKKLFTSKQNSATANKNISDESPYTWCTLSGGFMSHWTVHYFDTTLSTFYRPIWKCFCAFKLLIMFRILWVLSFCRRDNFENHRMHVHLGTFSSFMGGPLHYTELIALLWSLSEAAMYAFCINAPKEKFTHWLPVFLFLNQANIPNLQMEIDSGCIDLDDQSVGKLAHISKISFTMSSQYISQIITGFPVIIALLFYFNFPVEDFLRFGIPWIFIWALWAYCGCLVVYWLPSYFFVYCFYLKLRIGTINDQLNALSRQPGKGHKNSSRDIFRNDLTLRRLLFRHNEICREIDHSNRYWNRYLTLIFFLYTLIICILFYFFLFVTMPWYSYFEYAIVILSGHLLLLGIVIYAAKIVWSQSSRTFSYLTVANQKLPVSFRSKIKMMTYLERLKVNRQGFFLVSGQLLSAATYLEVLENMLKYFLLVVQNQ